MSDGYLIAPCIITLELWRTQERSNDDGLQTIAKNTPVITKDRRMLTT